MSRTLPLLKVLGAFAAMAALTIGVPVALATLIGWPLPQHVPNPATIIDTLTGDQPLDPTVIVHTLAVILWIAWARFTYDLVAEAVAIARGRVPAPHRLGRITQHLASTLIGTIATITPTASALAMTAPPPPLAGHELVIDTGTPTSEEHTAPQGPTTGHPEAVTGPMMIEHTVVRGDTLWDLAAHHLGDGTRCYEIYELNKHIIQPDGRALTNPSLVYPGWILQIPIEADPTATLTPEPAAAPAESAPPPPDDPTPTLTLVPETAPDAVDPAERTDPAAAPESPAPTQNQLAPNAPQTHTPAPPTGGDATCAPPPPEPTPATAEPGDTLPWRAPVAIGITGATVIATGVLLALRRRRTLHPGHPTKSGASHLEHAVTAAADVPFVRFVAHELTALAHQLAGTSLGAVPVAVELDPEDGIEILWDQPNPDAPRPWEATSGGWSWRTLYDPDTPIATDDNPVLIPGLVTIGHRGDRQVLIDLEALGSLAIVGDPERARDLLRAILTELAHGEELSNADVQVVDLDITDLPTTRRVTTTTSTEAMSTLRAVVQATQELLDDEDLPSTFAQRVTHPATPLPVTVTVATTDAIDPDDLTELAAPVSGVAVIIVGDAPGAAATLHLEADGTARLEPLGLVVAGVGLSQDLASSVAALIETDPKDSNHHLDGGDPISHPLDASPIGEPVITTPTPTTDDLDLPPDPPAPSLPELLVHVLGPPAIAQRPDLTRRELQLAVLLASRQRPTSPEIIQDAIWAGRAVSTKALWNLVSRTRSHLGTLPDGKQALPQRSRVDAALTIGAGVTTDLHLFEDLCQHAHHVASTQALEHLIDAVDLISGPPYGAEGYDWAHLDQTVAHAEAAIETAAVRIVELALDANAIDIARHGTAQALKALPANEVLYRLRMRIEDHASNPAGVRVAYDELDGILADLDAEPSPLTTELYRQLSNHRSTERV